MGRVIHFEILADDTQRAVKFYRSVFGWEIESWGGPMEYWLIKTGEDGKPGIDGAIAPRGDQSLSNNLTIGTESIDAIMPVIEKNGGKIVRPKSAVPGVGWLAYFNDTEGNMLGVMEEDPAAK